MAKIGKAKKVTKVLIQSIFLIFLKRNLKRMDI